MAGDFGRGHVDGGDALAQLQPGELGVESLGLGRVEGADLDAGRGAGSSFGAAACATALALETRTSLSALTWARMRAGSRSLPLKLPR
jgi:hypothetical protein